MSIHEMFLRVSDGILRYVPEYRINLIEPVTMNNEEISKFKSDFRQLATMIRCGRDKKKWESAIENNEDFKHMDPLTADLGNSVTKADYKLKINEKGEVDMCQAVKEIREEERMGKAKKMAISLSQQGVAIEVIAKAADVTVETVKNWIKSDECQAMKEIREEEHKGGRMDTLELIRKLLDDGRIEDVKKVADNPDYYDKLAQEYEKR